MAKVNSAAAMAAYWGEGSGQPVEVGTALVPEAVAVAAVKADLAAVETAALEVGTPVAGVAMRAQLEWRWRRWLILAMLVAILQVATQAVAVMVQVALAEAAAVAVALVVVVVDMEARRCMARTVVSAILVCSTISL